MIQAVTADRYKLQVCLDEPTRQALQQLQDALAHTPGCRDMNAAAGESRGQAMVHYLAHVQKRKYGLKTVDTAAPPSERGAAQSRRAPTTNPVAVPLPPRIDSTSQRAPAAGRGSDIRRGGIVASNLFEDGFAPRDPAGHPPRGVPA